jgi:hypothetical protein
MERFSLLGLVFCLLAPIELVHARIGESVEECALRYGPPDKEVSGGTLYKKAPFSIKIHFFEGKADSLTLLKIDDGAFQPMSPEEIEALITANFAGLKYSKQIEGQKIVYMAPFGTMGAIYNAQDFTLSIMSDGFVRREKELAAVRGEVRVRPTPTSIQGF